MSETQTAADAAPTMAPVLGGIAPYLTVDGAAKASEFYQRAFGAKEVARMPVDDKGRTMHVHLQINGASFMLSDGYPEHGHPHETPRGMTIILPMDEPDAWWERAVAEGATVTAPLQTMFWGDRYGALQDPWGFTWAVNAPAKRAG